MRKRSHMGRSVSVGFLTALEKHVRGNTSAEFSNRENRDTEIFLGIRLILKDV